MNPDNYCSVEMSRKLVEAGDIMKTEVIWHKEFPDGDFKLTYRDHYYQYHEFYPAPSMSELRRGLPEGARLSMARGFSIAYCSVEMSRKLVEAGDIMKTEVIWHKEFPDGDFKLTYRDHYYQYHEFYPAPSMSELWRELPEGARLSMARGFSIAATGDPEDFDHYVFSNVSPCDALASLLIWVRSQK